MDRSLSEEFMVYQGMLAQEYTYCHKPGRMVALRKLYKKDRLNVGEGPTVHSGECGTHRKGAILLVQSVV